ncbi:MAG: hypothetical protein WA093_00950 [Minisyncoccales bacterium]
MANKKEKIALVSSGEQFFDDCLICKAIQAARAEGRQLTEAELKEAFGKAKESGGVVGGSWFEN